MTQAVFNQIQRSDIYGQFQFMQGNRSVDHNHVKRLKLEMQSNPALLQAQPILDNENARNEFQIHSSVRRCMLSIEAVYNFNSKIRTRLY